MSLPAGGSTPPSKTHEEVTPDRDGKQEVPPEVLAVAKEILVCCEPKDKCRSRSRSKKKCRPGKITKNGFFNFLRCVRQKHCRWSAVKVAVEGAKLWCKMSARERKKYDACKLKGKGNACPAKRKKRCRKVQKCKCKKKKRKRKKKKKCACKKKRRRRKRKSCAPKRKKTACKPRRRKRKKKKKKCVPCLGLSRWMARWRPAAMRPERHYPS